jgi:Uma2 family endonuclease
MQPDHAVTPTLSGRRLGPRTVVLGEMPDVLISLIAERQRLGLDKHDEIWEGSYHMAPAPTGKHAKSGATIVRLLSDEADKLGLYSTLEVNIGGPKNFRVPDLAFHRTDPLKAWHATAAIVVEVRSPDDESYEKFDFYFAHGVEEILIADLVTEEVQWYVRSKKNFVESDHSEILSITNQRIAEALGW